MTDERIIEEMAALDGECIEDVVNAWRCGCGDPNYLTDHNACQRVIDGMDYKGLVKYWDELFHILWESTFDVVLLSLKATPRQKCEAILKAYGKWDV